MSTTKIDYAHCKDTPVWRDPQDCVVAVNGGPNATLGDMSISEPDRRFLAERFSLLSRDQLRDLFAAARVELLEEQLEESSGLERTLGSEDWADVFLEKAGEIIKHRCRAAYSDGHRAKSSDHNASFPAGSGGYPGGP
jgi:hypothetical protein